MKYIQKYLLSILFLIMTVSLFTGCSVKQITSEGITPDKIITNNIHDKTVVIDADGGREKDPLGIYEISNDLLVSAVTKAITSSKLFSQVVKTHADYKLELFIVRIEQPFAGYDMTVNVEIAWILLDTKDETVLWKDSIITTVTKTRNDEGNGASRLVLATEEATRQNISNGLELISSLNLK